MFHFISHHYLMPRYLLIVYKLRREEAKYYRSITYVHDGEKKRKRDEKYPVEKAECDGKSEGEVSFMYITIESRWNLPTFCNVLRERSPKNCVSLSGGSTEVKLSNDPLLRTRD